MSTNDQTASPHEATPLRVRDAGEHDLAAITEIYNDAVLHSTAIWNETPVDLENRRAWMRDRARSGFPILIAERGDGETIAYASFGDWRPFSGYRQTVEHSIYVRTDVRRTGVGALLVGELIARARLLGKHAMIAGIDATNAGSIRLHEKFGFMRVGTFPEVGAKFGSWLDLTCMELRLDDAASPTPVTAHGTSTADDTVDAERTPTITEVRAQIDDLDRRIVDLIAERQRWVVRAGSLKSDESAVRAPARVEQVIEKVRELARTANASPDVVEGAYRALIAGFIDLELYTHRVRSQDGLHPQTAQP